MVRITTTYVTRLRPAALICIAALLAGAGGVLDATPAQAAGCGSGIAGDVNGGGFGELAVSSAGVQNHRGAVSVFYGQNGHLAINAEGSALEDQYLDQETSGVPGEAGAENRFGAATAFGDFNGDGCADLAIGAPGDAGSGSVTVLLGSPRGLSRQTAQRFGPQTSFGTGRGSEFGRSLAVGDFDGDRIEDLAVAAPELDIAGQTQAGGVAIFRGSAAGLSTAQGQPIAYTQNSPGVPGAAGTEFRFGSALAAGDFDGNGVTELAVGFPSSEATFSGRVQILDARAAGGQQPAPITADSLGVPHELEPTSSFGATLAAGDTDADGRDELAIGAPDAVPPPPSDQVSGGAVFVVRGSTTGLTPGGYQTWTQNNVGVPDPEVDPHRFGAALTFGHFDAGPTADLAIGEPYDELPSISAGSVTVLFGGSTGLSAAGSRYLHQGVPGVEGTNEDGDRFGTSVAPVTLRRDGQQALVVGTPGEDLENKANVGRIHRFAITSSGPGATGSQSVHLGTPGVKGDPRKSAAFGLTATGG